MALKQKRNNRIWELDALRGLCIAMMVVDHSLMLLQKFIGGAFIDTPLAFLNNWAVDWSRSAFRLNNQRWVVFLFFFISGISSSLTRSNLARAVKVGAAAMTVTVFTYILSKELNEPSLTISFGILHSLATCMFFGFVVCTLFSALQMLADYLESRAAPYKNPAPAAVQATTAAPASPMPISPLSVLAASAALPRLKSFDRAFRAKEPPSVLKLAQSEIGFERKVYRAVSEYVKRNWLTLIFCAFLTVAAVMLIDEGFNLRNQVIYASAKDPVDFRVLFFRPFNDGLDYYPIIPYLGFYFIGIAFGKLFYVRRRTLLPLPFQNTPAGRIAFAIPIKPFSFIGANTLIIYIAHLPLIYLLFFLLAKICGADIGFLEQLGAA